tara:strand:- start:1266 stop:1892 length:627 start_codon:yes stop_codon:yes gene_type:complete
MQKNKTEIVIVVDRSGSMGAIREDMEGGIKGFITEQQKLEGETRITYCQFDTEYELVFENKIAADVKDIAIVPRGMTALVDAVGRSINEVGERLAKTDKKDRPEKVIFLVITDGMENSSRELSAEKVKEMVQHQEDEYNWEFVFLGSNIDAVAVGATMGFQQKGSMTYDSNTVGVTNALNSVTCYASTTRSGMKASFSAEDRTAASKG